MRSHRLFTLGPDNERLWVPLYIEPLDDRRVATILADGVAPSGPDEVKGRSFFGDTLAEAKELALGYLGGSVEQNWGRADVVQQGNAEERVTLQELAVPNAYEIAALVAVLAEKGIPTQTEVVEEMARLGEKPTTRR